MSKKHYKINLVLWLETKRERFGFSTGSLVGLKVLILIVSVKSYSSIWFFLNNYTRIFQQKKRPIAPPLLQAPILVT